MSADKCLLFRRGQCERTGVWDTGPGGRDVTAGAEVRTDMSWCNPVPVFVPGSPSLVTGHTVTMGQHMETRPDTDHYPGTEERCATASYWTLSKLGRGQKLGTEKI